MEFHEVKQTLTKLLAVANDDAVIEFDSGRPGPTLAVVALTHGDEYSGLLTVARLHSAIHSNELNLVSGRLVLLFANFEILLNADNFDQLERHRGVDLNRVWDENDAVIRNGNLGGGELAVRNRLLPYLKQVDHIVDLHSTSLPSTPMGIFVTTSASLSHRIIDVLDVDWVFQNIHEYINGVSLIERHQNERQRIDSQTEALSLVIEAGQHSDFSSIKRNLDNVLQIMSALGLIENISTTRTYNPTALNIYRAGLAKAAGDVIEWRYADSPASFDSVQDGDVICTLHDEPVVAEGDSLVVMPRLRAIAAGDEMFYLARPVRT